MEQTTLRRKAYPSRQVARRASLERQVSHFELSIERIEAAIQKRLEEGQAELANFQHELEEAKARLAV